MTWKRVRHVGDLPSSGGTRAVVYLGGVAWMYYNPDKRTWHPLNGWRRVIGQPWNTVTMYYELPDPPNNRT